MLRLLFFSFIFYFVYGFIIFQYNLQVAVGDVIYVEANSGAVKGWAEVMLLLQNLTLRRKSMFHFLKERFTKRRR